MEYPTTLTDVEDVTESVVPHNNISINSSDNVWDEVDTLFWPHIRISTVLFLATIVLLVLILSCVLSNIDRVSSFLYLQNDHRTSLHSNHATDEEYSSHPYRSADVRQPPVGRTRDRHFASVIPLTTLQQRQYRNV